MRNILNDSTSIVHPSQRSLKEPFISNRNHLDARRFVLIKIKTQHVTHCQPEVVQILADLFLALGMIPRAMPDFQFDNNLLTEIIDNDICSGLISCLRFNIIVASPVNDWFQVQQEQLSSVFFRSMEKGRIFAGRMSPARRPAIARLDPQ